MISKRAQINVVEIQTIAQWAGVGNISLQDEAVGYCYFCGAACYYSENGIDWEGGEPDCPHMIDLG